ncbi:hypothetical protein G9A89_011485 [Geosiphon pyriformis]|nr:hypothetical protein G9A89_011485 [Geosiphon pyriformis]
MEGQVGKPAADVEKTVRIILDGIFTGRGWKQSGKKVPDDNAKNRILEESGGNYRKRLYCYNILKNAVFYKLQRCALLSELLD